MKEGRRVTAWLQKTGKTRELLRSALQPRTVLLAFAEPGTNRIP